MRSCSHLLGSHFECQEHTPKSHLISALFSRPARDTSPCLSIISRLLNIHEEKKFYGLSNLYYQKERKLVVNRKTIFLFLPFSFSLSHLLTKVLTFMYLMFQVTTLSPPPQCSLPFTAVLMINSQA